MKPSHLISVVSAFVIAVAAITFFLASLHNPIAQAAGYGYQPVVIGGISVISGTTTTQNIRLTPATFYVVSGTVKDAITGWPLYASLNIGGYPTGTLWNDPVTGFYSVALAESIPYTLSVNAWAAGYNSVSRIVAPLTNSRTENFTLTVNSATCNAPGYTYANLQDFEANNGGYSVSGSTSWAWGTPLSGPGSAHSGIKAWATNLSGDYNNGEDGYLTSPNINLSIYAGQSLTLSWWQWLWTEKDFDYASIEASNDGGGSWTVVYGPTSGVLDTAGWVQRTAELGSSYAVSNFRVRFHFTSDSGVAAPGWYVDDVSVSAHTCIVLSGGLVIGNVYDANTNVPLTGATVRNDSGRSTTTILAADPMVDDPFYTLFSPAGSHVFTATKTNYGNAISTTNVVQSRTIRLDLRLPAGFLVYMSSGLQVTLDLGISTTLPFTLANSGGLAATFGLREYNRGRALLPLVDSGAPLKRIHGKFFGGSLAGHRLEAPLPGAELPIAPETPPWTAIANYPVPVMDNTAAEFNDLIYSVGGVDDHFATLNAGYVYDPNNDSWLPIASMIHPRERPAVAFIDGLLYVVGGWAGFYTSNTVPTLEIYNPGTNTWTTGAPVPTAYAAATGVALDGQFYVIGGCAADCGATNVFRYDPGSNSWTAVADYPVPVSWNACGAINGLIYCAGGLNAGELNATYVYNPSANTWTPLANMPQTQWAMGFTVVDDLLFISGGVTDNFATVTNEGFYYDPDANTWTPIANSNNVLYRGASACGFYKIGGSIGGFSPASSSEVYPGLNNCAPDVPWLKESPVTGTIMPLASQYITITFDTSVPEIKQPGTYYAQLQIHEDTPYRLTSVPVTLTVTFHNTFLPLIIKNF